MKYDLILRDATIVSSTGRQVADVAIRGGRIAYVGPRPPRRAHDEIQAIGKFLMPGVIDTGAQFDPSGNGKVWEHESRAAVSGGTTTVISLPDVSSAIDGRTAAQSLEKKIKGKSWCNYGFWGVATRDNLSELNKAIDDGILLGALAYLGEGDMSIGSEHLEAYLGLHGVLGVQIDDEDIEENVQAIIAAARKAERWLHLVHLSTATELQYLDPVHGDVPVTAGVTPHHLFLSVEEDEAVVTRPPVRSESDRRTLWTAMKRGRLDCVASDHRPSTNGEDGVPGAELLFPLLLSAVKYGRLSLEGLVSLCAERPAEIFGLPNKGKIEKGADADLLLFSEGEVERVDATELLSKAGWSPYDAREAAPKPELVMVNGQIVARRGELFGDKPNGLRVSRQELAEA